MDLRFSGLGGLLLAMLVLAGCDTFKDKTPPPLEYSLNSPYPGMTTWAVAPMINLAGVKEFDSLSYTDLLFGELQQVRNLTILPVNRTLEAMNRLGLRAIDSPQAARAVAELLHVDGLIFASISLLEPYDPPTVGMTLQLYTLGRPMPRGPEPRDLEIRTRQPAAQVSAVFNATNQTVRRELQDYAKGRSEFDPALGERRYLVDIDSYMRFVCHAMIRRLLDLETAAQTRR